MRNTPRPSLDLRQETRSALLQFARRALQAAAAGARPPKVPARLSEQPELADHHGCFVTLHSHKGLRGCIGTFSSGGGVAEVIGRMARQSALHDPRFAPVTPDEVEDLELEVSLLSPRSVGVSAHTIEVGRHGVAIDQSGTSAVFLPQVATEHAWNRTTLLAQLCRKAGLHPDAWQQSSATLSTFEAIVFGDPPRQSDAAST